MIWTTDSRWTRPDPPPAAQTRSSFVRVLVYFFLFPSSVFTLKLWFTINRDIQQQRLMISTKSRIEDGHNFPRVVHLEGHISFGPQRLGIHRTGQQHEFELPDLIREVGIPGHYATPPEGECKWVHRWHLTQHPTCNSMHEMDFFFGLQKMRHREHRTPKAKLLNSGGTRDAWKFSITEFDDDTGSNLDRLFAVRTLRLLKDYLWTRVENQRVDAIVNERLSSSQNVIDIYGFCGTGTVNELADSGTLYNYLESFNSTYLDRLSLARDIAHGIADIHEVDGNPAGLVQHDVKLANVLVSGGRAKIADFNNCHFAQQRDDGSQCYFNFAQACERLKSHITVSLCIAMVSLKVTLICAYS